MLPESEGGQLQSARRCAPPLAAASPWTANAQRSFSTHNTQSCGGISVQEARLTPQGLPYDRRWMVVDEATGRAVTQRTVPLMATIRTALPPEAFTAEDASALPAGAALTLSAPNAPGGAPLRVPLALDTGKGAAPRLARASVWEWKGPAADEGDVAAEWLSAVLGRRVRLVRYIGSLDPEAASEAAAALAAAAAAGDAGGIGGVGALEAAREALRRPVDPEFAPWGGEVAFAGERAVVARGSVLKGRERL